MSYLLPESILTALLKVNDVGNGDIGKPIPRHNITPPSLPVYEYTLEGAIEDKFLKFSYTRPAELDFGEADDPMLMRVPEECMIKLTLGGSLNWHFLANGPSVFLKDATGTDPRTTPIETRYADLVPTTIPLNCKSVTFYAKYLPMKDNGKPQKNVDNFDRINILVVIDLPPGNGATGSGSPLLLIIDPDIKNPGDDTIE